MSTDSLSHRIVTAFTLLTAVVAGLFAVAIVVFINQSEIQLVAEGLNRQLDVIISTARPDSPPYLGPELSLFRSTGGDEASLPSWLRGLSPGFREIQFNGVDWHVLVRDIADQRYILVLDQIEFEQREDMLYIAASTGFVLSVLAAFLIGTATAHRVIAPVIRLAGQVQHRDQLLPLAPPLAADYPSNEVGQLARAFDNTLNQLRQALDRERLFTSDVSHELRTPLMVIASTCELLQETLPMDARERSQIERIRHAADEMRELVETFLWLARGSASASEQASSSSLTEIAEEQLRRWRPEAIKRGLQLEFVPIDDDARRYPAPMLRAVLSNLLRNALHYTDHGSVRLELTHHGFRVIDTGAGIPEAERLSVFHPFVRGDRTRGDGVGIGLSLVQRICAQQGWQIQLAEADGGGCDFTVTLHPPSPPPSV